MLILIITHTYVTLEPQVVELGESDVRWVEYALITFCDTRQTLIIITGMASVWTRSRFAAWMTLIAFLGMLANADKHQMEFKSVLSSFMIVLMSFLLNYAPLIIHLVRGGGVASVPSASSEL